MGQIDLLVHHALLNSGAIEAIEALHVNTAHATSVTEAVNLSQTNTGRMQTEGTLHLNQWHCG